MNRQLFNYGKKASVITSLLGLVVAIIMIIIPSIGNENFIQGVLNFFSWDHIPLLAAAIMLVFNGYWMGGCLVNRIIKSNRGWLYGGLAALLSLQLAIIAGCITASFYFPDKITLAELPETILIYGFMTNIYGGLPALIMGALLGWAIKRKKQKLEEPLTGKLIDN